MLPCNKELLMASKLSSYNWTFGLFKHSQSHSFDTDHSIYLCISFFTKPSVQLIDGFFGWQNTITLFNKCTVLKLRLWVWPRQVKAIFFDHMDLGQAKNKNSLQTSQVNFLLLHLVHCSYSTSRNFGKHCPNNSLVPICTSCAGS